MIRLLFETRQPWGVHYSNPRVDEMLRSATRIIDPDRRLRLYQAALTVIREDAPVAFLHQLVDICGRRKGAPVFPQIDQRISVYNKWK
ncbi:MAG: hypothetical protein HY660_08875 [Armatimonadetes bacterium]|nr:hypothetical protein [Armatimonadota bacterium]